MNKEQQIEEMANYYCEYCKKQTGEKFCEHIDDKSCNIFFEAELFYNAGYRKIFTSDFASDTQKAYKEGYDKGFLDGWEEFDIILQRNKQLIQAREILKSDIERLKTQLQQANAGIVNCSGCHLVELNAVKEFADKLKGKLQDFGDGSEKGAYITENDIDGLLKEYEQ